MVVPTHKDGSKRPFGFWKNYQDADNRQDFDHIARLIQHNDTGAIGVITGKASGNVEMIELEGRAVTPETMDRLTDAAKAAGLSELWAKLQTGCVEQSPSGGIHFFVRISDQPVEGNKPLAERPNPDDPTLVERLAETRGEGGFVVVAPSQPRTGHEVGYKFVKDINGECTPDRTPMMTKAEVEELHRIFATLDERVHTIEQTPIQIDGTRPGDDFANKTDWAEILEPHGWVNVYSIRGNTYWRRPGKSEGVSASTKDGWFYVFTTSTVFEANRSYGKFFTYAKLNHNGDLTAAAKELRSKGYGQTNQPQSKPKTSTVIVGDPKRMVVATPLSDVSPEPTDWLWEGRMALGALNLLSGREGLGKSTVGYHIAAEVTLGNLPGFFHGHPKSVIIGATEDSFPKTIIPRLLAAGANMDRIFRVDVAEHGVISEIDLPTDVAGLAQTIRETDAALVLLDPLMSRLSAGLDSHKDAEVRQALEPIVRVCEETNATMLGVIHHNKTVTDDPNTAVMGSRAFVAVCRANHAVVLNPNDPTHATRIFETTKNNLGRLDLPALEFVIESATIETRVGRPAITGRLVWQGESPIRAAEAMRGSGKGGGAMEKAKEFLTEFLTEQGGVASKADVVAAGVAEGHAVKTIERAAKSLWITSPKGGVSGVWELPAGESRDK
jgi:hypothetical protein